MKGLIANKGITRREKRFRASLLRKAEQSARTHNSKSGRQYNQQLNKFSLMTQHEKNGYLGLQNMTLSEEDDLPLLSSKQPRLQSVSSVPDEFDHRDHGHVTNVKDQLSCGACWAFAAAGAFEGSYSSVTGILKSFSVKELLDCSYTSKKNTCGGGWFTSAWRYIKKAGRLASERDIKYFPAQESCTKWDGKPNGIRNADYIGYYRSSKNHEGVKKVIKSYTPAVGFTVEDDFYGYEVGHYDGCDTWSKLNHGIILVGYGPDYWEGKNSWGADWGDKGFVKFTRSKANVCRVLDYVMYPVVISRDRGEDDAPDVHSDEELVEVAARKQVTTSDGASAPDAVDGDTTSCHFTTSSSNPYFKVNLSEKHRVQRVEIVTDKAAELVDGKVYVGTRGDFLDRWLGVIKEVEDGKVVIRTEEPVDGSWVYLEVYGKGMRALSVCEIRVFAAPTKDNTGLCSAGTILCPDGVCRHSHMC